MLDCWLSRTRDPVAAEAFFRRTSNSTECTPEHVVTDTATFCPSAIRTCAPDATHTATGFSNPVISTNRCERNHGSEAAAAGCEWLDVAFEDHLRPFTGACGSRRQRRAARSPARFDDRIGRDSMASARHTSTTMPHIDLVLEFFRHNTMMNRRLLEACQRLGPEQLGATARGTYGSIGATLAHIANAQLGYAARLLDTDRPEPLPEDPFPGFEALAERLALGNARLEEAAIQAGRDRRVQVTGDDPPGTWWMPASLFLLQAVNHGTEHRSQVATILTQLGVEPPDMDGWAYFFASGHMVPVEPRVSPETG